jgi:hypothetical protein
LTDIALWKDIIQDNIPNAKFLYQEQTEAFKEITKYSNFPYFSTNLSQLEPQNHPTLNDDRVQIPITDSAAKMDFYASYLKEQKNVLNQLSSKLILLGFR